MSCEKIQGRKKQLKAGVLLPDAPYVMSLNKIVVLNSKGSNDLK